MKEIGEKTHPIDRSNTSNANPPIPSIRRNIHLLFLDAQPLLFRLSLPNYLSIQTTTSNTRSIIPIPHTTPIHLFRLHTPIRHRNRK